MEINSNEQALKDLIKAALDAEGQLTYLLGNQLIKGVTTRAPLEKLITSIQAYKQAN